ncbi:MAG TPA: Fis family transcriptional regulator [Verrucomicrobiales bacterium]|nr:Fis family transcriptional regulator [Verrucomicrobiales bacterium]
MTISVFDSENAKPMVQRLSALGFNCQRFDSGSIKELSHEYPDVVYMVPIAALNSADWPTMRVKLAQANRYYVVVGRDTPTEEIVLAVRDGAHDFLQLEDFDSRWESAVRKIVESQKLWLQLYGGIAKRGKELLMGESPSMRALRQSIDRLGPTNATVLITGESGVGKELVATSLHRTNNTGPFVAVNCAAIPKDLIEAELFGAERGAYTGSIKARQGLVEQANGGTLFLDEIGELDFGLQPKLLRFLETRAARRVGANSEYKVQVRVISATNQNLEQLISKGQFRADLFYRISEVTLPVSPLRVRKDDIAVYALAFVRAAGERFGKHFENVEPELVRLFQEYDWPGNVRELKNAIERMVILYDGPTLRAGWWEAPLQYPAPEAALAGQLAHGSTGRMGASAPYPAGTSLPLPVTGNLSRKQRLELAARLISEGGHDLTWVAAQVGVNSSTLYRWRKANKI